MPFPTDSRATLGYIFTITDNGLSQAPVAERRRRAPAWGAGVEMRGFLAERAPDLADDVILTNVRQHEAISRACRCLHAADAALAHQTPHEMVLLDLYGALTALNELTGEVVTEDILDRIFSTFCIGK